MLVVRRIDVDSKLLLGVELFSRRGTDPPAFLHGLTKKHDLFEAVLLVDIEIDIIEATAGSDLSEAVLLVNGYGYLTVLSRLERSA